MAFDLSGILKQYMGGAPAPTSGTPADHFHDVAKNAPSEVVSDGLSEAFRSNQTPPFGQMVGDLFRNASPQQQAAMLNQLLGSLNPAVLSSVATSLGLGRILGQQSGGSTATVSPQDAAKLDPQQVQEVASKAEQHDPTIIDKMSDFYAQHPGLVRTLGSAALTIALAKIANGMTSRT
jgi:hypothetical protein